MTATSTWTALENSRSRARRTALMQVGVPLGLSGVAAAVATLPSAPDSGMPLIAGVGALLLATYSVLTARPARRAFERHHQTTILPKILEDVGADLVCSPDATPSWVVLHRSRLFPPAQQARPGPLLHGVVDGVFLEAGAVVLTTEKVIRKVRRVQRPVFSGAVYMVDLGAQVDVGDVVVLARGARWPRAARKGSLWMRLPAKGLAWGTRVYGRVGSNPVFPQEAAPFVADALRLHRRASLSIQDRRHLVVAVPGRASLFRPASLFAPLARDARAAKSLSAMRVIAALASALGAPQSTHHRPVEAEEVIQPETPKEALFRAYGRKTPKLSLEKTKTAWSTRRQGLSKGWSAARAHPTTQRATLAVADMVRSLRGSAPATAAQERTLEAWDDLRGRLGIASGPRPEPRVVVAEKTLPLDEGLVPVEAPQERKEAAPGATTVERAPDA